MKSLKDFAKKRLPDKNYQELDARDECPLEIVRHMCSPDKLGIQLLFIPEEFGGIGGGAFDVYLRLRRDGAHRSGRRHGGAGHVPGQRSDHGRRHAGAEENLAERESRKRDCCSPTAPPNRKPAAIWAR